MPNSVWEIAPHFRGKIYQTREIEREEEGERTREIYIEGGRKVREMEKTRRFMRTS